MNKIYTLILIVYICFVIFLIFNIGEASEVHRQKRYLRFVNKSRIFFRLNFKNNMLAWSQLFAHAVGIKLNYDLPPDSFHAHHHISRRALYRNMEVLLNGNGLDGFHCVRRAICEISDMNEPTSMYFKILKMVFRQQSTETEKWHNTSEVDCQLSVKTCPFSMLEISSYTDL